MARWGRTDFRQLKNLQEKLGKLNKTDLDAFRVQMVKQLAARMLAKVVKRTPVGAYPAGSGKVGGTLRRGWTVGQVMRNGDVYEVEIINPVMYASYVEYGHRTVSHTGWVQGRFMMTVSEQELDRDAPQIIEKALEKKLREVFGK